MRVIFINPPKFSKYLINFLSLFYKEKFFLNHGDLEINSYLIKKNIKPVDFSHIQSNNIKNYIFGDSSIYKHTKSFFFKNFEIFFKRNFSKNLKKKTILLSLLVPADVKYKAALPSLASTAIIVSPLDLAI